LNAAIFLRELYPDKNEVVRALYDDIAPLKQDAQKLVFNLSLERWLELHTIESFTSEEDHGKRDGPSYLLYSTTKRYGVQGSSCIGDIR
jgi:hypothetical protein